MTELTTTVVWVDARERLPKDGQPVAAAITGHYPAGSRDSGTARGEEFWLVMKMVFTHRHWAEDGTEHHDCFIDSDRVVRFPYSPDSDDSVTHWAELPTLPGQATHYLSGADVRPALQQAWGAPQRPTAAP